MPYVDPATVDSPKGRVRKVSVLFDTGIGPLGARMDASRTMPVSGKAMRSAMRFNSVC